jgi:hypothetical protein
MGFKRLSTIVIAGGFVLVTSAAVAPRWTSAAVLATQPATQPDDKTEEPKGDPVDVDKLPKAVVDAVKKEMPGARITKAAKLDDGNFYLDDVKVGKKLWDVTVSPKGKIIKKVEMKD